MDDSYEQGDTEQNESLQGLTDREYAIKNILRDHSNPKAIFHYFDDLPDHVGRVSEGYFYWESPYAFEKYHLAEHDHGRAVCWGVSNKPIGYIEVIDEH